MKRFIILALFSCLMLGSCSPLMVKSDFDHSINFSQYQTYAIRQNDLKLNDIDTKRVISALNQQLQMRGLQASGTPDLIINVTASHKRIRDIQTQYPWHVGWGWGWGPYWRFGVGYHNTYTDIYNKGTLRLDFIDAKTNKLVWQGVGSGLDVDSPKAKYKQIPEVIQKILANYPPTGSLKQNF